VAAGVAATGSPKGKPVKLKNSDNEGENHATLDEVRAFSDNIESQLTLVITALTRGVRGGISKGVEDCRRSPALQAATLKTVSRVTTHRA
jgi:hypothetical protein